MADFLIVYALPGGIIVAQILAIVVPLLVAVAFLTLAERKVIVHGTAPFLIKEIKGIDKNLVVRDTTTGSKAVHVLSVTFRPTAVGDLQRTLQIITDLKEENTVEFTTRAQVVP